MNKLFTAHDLGIVKNSMENYKVYDVVPEEVKNLMLKTDTSNLESVIWGNIFLEWLKLNEEIITLFEIKSQNKNGNDNEVLSFEDEEDEEISAITPILIFSAYERDFLSTYTKNMEVKYQDKETIKLAVNNSCFDMLKILNSHRNIVKDLFDPRKLQGLKNSYFPYTDDENEESRNFQFILEIFAGIVIPCYLKLENDNTDALLAYYEYKQKHLNLGLYNSTLVDTFYSWADTAFKIQNSMVTPEGLKNIAQDENKRKIFIDYWSQRTNIKNLYQLNLYQNLKQIEKLTDTPVKEVCKEFPQITNEIIGSLDTKERLLFAHNYSDFLDMNNQYNYLFGEIYPLAFESYINGNDDEEIMKASIPLINNLITKYIRNKQYRWEKDKTILDVFTELKNKYPHIFELLCSIKIKDLRDFDLKSVIEESGNISHKGKNNLKEAFEDEILQEKISNNRIIDFIWYTHVKYVLSRHDISNILKNLDKIIKLGFEPEFVYYDTNKYCYFPISYLEIIGRKISNVDSTVKRLEYLKSLSKIYPKVFTTTYYSSTYLLASSFVEEEDLLFFKQMGMNYENYKDKDNNPFFGISLLTNLRNDKKRRYLLSQIEKGKFKDDLNTIYKSYCLNKDITFLTRIEEGIERVKQLQEDKQKKGITSYEEDKDLYYLLEIKDVIVKAGAKTYQQLMDEEFNLRYNKAFDLTKTKFDKTSGTSNDKGNKSKTKQEQSKQSNKPKQHTSKK